MARCTSWRYTGGQADTDDILPVGADRAIWRPCRSRVPAGTTRCTDCENALLLCPSVAVRRALVSEDSVSLEVLRTMTTDSNPGIALIAEQKLDDLEQDDTEYDHLLITTPTPQATRAPSVWS